MSQTKQQVQPFDVGYAGLKDRHAVTSQHFTVPVRPPSSASRLRTCWLSEGCAVCRRRASGTLATPCFSPAS